ncbi:MAG: hypothetical protein V2A62_01860 [Candidatus Woesearchaeota archaeon]
MVRGRPLKSPIRQNIIEILYYLHEGYGYQISKIYLAIFPKVVQRSIYYHLRQGVKTKEMEVKEIKQETGDFSWGSTVEKIIYALGPQAEPKGEPRVKEYLERRGKK